MAQPISNLSQQAGALRNLKFLVVLLVVSNLAVGIVSVYLLHVVDQRYSELVENSAPALNDLVQLMSAVEQTESVTASALPLATATARADALRAAQTGLALEERSAGYLFSGADLAGVEPTLRADLKAAGEKHRAAVASYIRTYAAEQLESGSRPPQESILRSFKDYTDSISRTAKAISELSDRYNTDYTNKTNRLSRIVVAIASWPILVLVALLLLTAVFVIAMMIAFRGKDLADMP
jgi:hypothetical protein